MCCGSGVMMRHLGGTDCASPCGPPQHVRLTAEGPQGKLHPPLMRLPLKAGEEVLTVYQELPIPKDRPNTLFGFSASAWGLYLEFGFAAEILHSKSPAFEDRLRDDCRVVSVPEGKSDLGFAAVILPGESRSLRTASDTIEIRLSV
jgi:hypothetical protein